jgi:hypothetical protein
MLGQTISDCCIVEKLGGGMSRQEPPLTILPVLVML